MKQQEFGKLIATFDTKLSDVFLRRILASSLPLIVMLGIWYMVEVTRAKPFTFHSGVYTIIGILLAWVLAHVFLRKRYYAEIYENGLLLTEKMRKRTKWIAFEDVKCIGHGIHITMLEDILPIWRHREVTISFADEPVKGIASFFRNIKTAWALSITGANMKHLKRFGNELTAAFYREEAE